MTFADILEATKAESLERQRRHPPALVQREAAKMGPTRGFAKALAARPFSLIAELKRRSPSMGEIAPQEAAIEDALRAYAEHPVVGALSVLTQSAHFGGSPADLERALQATLGGAKPVLRKDFIFSDYEVHYSRWIGADAILLMANVVSDPTEFARLHALALSLGLDVLCEVHDEAEIAVLPATARVCGINARRFKGVDQRPAAGSQAAERDTQTDLGRFELFAAVARRLPSALKVAESGISAGNIGEVLRKFPFNAALVGTSLLKSGGSLPAALDRIQAEAAAALKRPAASAAV